MRLSLACLCLAALIGLCAIAPLRAADKSSESGANFPDEDKDQDGLTNDEEAEYHSNSESPHSDSDNVPDGQDAVPADPDFTFPRVPVTQYALVDLGEGAAQVINNNGQVVIHKWNQTDQETVNMSYGYMGFTSDPNGFSLWSKDEETPITMPLPSDLIENIVPSVTYPAWCIVSLSDSGKALGIMGEEANDIGYQHGTNIVFNYLYNEVFTWTKAGGIKAVPITGWLEAPLEHLGGGGVIEIWFNSFPCMDNGGTVYGSAGDVWAMVDFSDPIFIDYYGSGSRSIDYALTFTWNSEDDPVPGSLWLREEAGDTSGSSSPIRDALESWKPRPFKRVQAVSPDGNWKVTWEEDKYKINGEKLPGTGYSLNNWNKPMVGMYGAVALNINGAWKAKSLYVVHKTNGGTPLFGKVTKINDRGQMLVGGLLWQNGKAYSVSDLTPATQGADAKWGPLAVTDLNDKGLMVGTSTQIRNPDGTDIPAADQKPHAVILLPFDIAVDANRDGVVKFAGNFDSEEAQGKPTDKTEETKPLAFWLNDDDDRNDKDAVDSSHKDSDDGTINSRRDLEDFARLNIYVGGLHEAITSGQIKVGLKWKNTGGTSPRVKVWRNKSANGGNEYLTDDDVAQEHLSLGLPGDVQGTTPYIIPTQFWTDLALSESQPNGYLLFEAISEGKGQLCITIHDTNGTEIGEGPGVWLDLMNVKKMYERAKGTPENGIDAPFESYFSQPNPPPTGYVDDPNGHPFQEPHDEDDSLIVLVHGIHAPFTAAPDAYKGNILCAEIVFKRLWHQGFKGRFAFYKWPALNPAGFGGTGFEFNGSEYRAWKYGRGLAQFVNSINKASKNLYAHSQGNIVCGAALTDFGLSVDNYVLTQAAVPAGCYDTSGGQSDPTSINGYARFWTREASKPTPDFASDLGYRGYLQTLAVSGNVRSFYNAVDYALATGTSLLGLLETHWEANEDSYKPDGSFSNANWYTYIPGNPAGQRSQLVDALFVGRFVIDPHEAMSMVARPRSKAIGARSGVGGSIDTGLNLESFTSTSGDQVFTRSSDDHGAQVGRRIQEVWDYYTELGRTFGVIPLPE